MGEDVAAAVIEFEEPWTLETASAAVWEVTVA